MQDTSAFPSPEEYPGITKYVKLCAEFGKTVSLDSFQLQEELDRLQKAWMEALHSTATVKNPDDVFHIIRDEDGEPEATVTLDRQTWVNLLAMEAMDDNGPEEELRD
jgi:hypothetical protein